MLKIKPTVNTFDCNKKIYIKAASLENSIKTNQSIFRFSNDEFSVFNEKWEKH